MGILMKSRVVKFLCQDCLGAVLALIVVLVFIIFLGMACVASQHSSKPQASDAQIRHSLSRQQDLLNKERVEFEELTRSGELRLF